ncbi:hypothetical protein HDV00_005629 [Rhizophlyctis rosea]|nr:hypothetical protein HDV00_005629 [Rhizophlyctis rosea]
MSKRKLTDDNETQPRPGYEPEPFQNTTATRNHNIISMDKPVKFIDIDPSSGHFAAVAEAADILSRMDKPIKVVGCVGELRGGKSFLMNRLHGSSKGFELGSTEQSVTKGIWMRVQLLEGSGEYLVLLDPEGLFDLELQSDVHDNKLFVLSVLLTSFLIVNAKNNIDAGLLRDLGIIADLTNHIRVTASHEPENGQDFDALFPELLILVRDFTLNMSRSETEYLERSLRPIVGTSEAVDRANETREKIRRWFRNRHCMTVPHPFMPAARVENSSFEDLHEDFRRGINRVVEFVHSRARVKTFGHQNITRGSSIPINGDALQLMAKSYCQSFNEGSIPVIESTWDSVSEQACQRAYMRGISEYRDVMERDAVPNFPMESDFFLEVHQEALAAAGKVYMDNAIGKQVLDILAQLKSFNDLDAFNAAKQTALTLYLADAQGPASGPGYQRLLRELETLQDMVMNRLQIDQLKQDQSRLQIENERTRANNDELARQIRTVQLQADEDRALHEREIKRINEEHLANVKRFQEEHEERLRNLEIEQRRAMGEADKKHADALNKMKTEFQENQAREQRAHQASLASLQSQLQQLSMASMAGGGCFGGMGGFGGFGGGGSGGGRRRGPPSGVKTYIGPRGGRFYLTSGGNRSYF